MNIHEMLKKLLEGIRKISIKRLFVLSGFMAFAAAIIFLCVFVSTSEIAAFSSFKPETFKDILKDKKQNLNALYKESYTEISKRDKDLAYIYLREKCLAKSLGCTIYRMKSGENFWTVAKKFRVNIDTIIGANPELDGLKAFSGEQIIVINRRGVIHEVKEAGENTKILAEVYKTDRGSIEKENNITLGILRPGDLVFIPGVRPVFISENLQKLYEKRNMFRSPLSGRYTSLMGTRVHPVTGEVAVHQGVDIRAEMGSWVGASAEGVVVFAGWAGNLGYAVKIKHKEGYMSVYGHLSKIFVHEGQRVPAGKLIAKSGNSGRTTGPHLHFAIYKDGQLQDPLKFLW
jgi:murein DD-endopeptidase MepM/ murein hydrolase activator NlpD